MLGSMLEIGPMLEPNKTWSLSLWFREGDRHQTTNYVMNYSMKIFDSPFPFSQSCSHKVLVFCF